MPTLSELLLAPPPAVTVEGAGGEVSIAVRTTNGPGRPWQERLGAISFTVFLVIMLTGGVAEWLSPGLLEPISGPVCLVLAVSMIGLVLSHQKRTGRALLLRGNSLSIGRYSVTLDRISRVRRTTYKVRKSKRVVRRLALTVDGTQKTWDMPVSSGDEVDWIASVVRAAVSERRRMLGTASEVPRALSALAGQAEQAQGER